jgi:hypothetical protein
MSQPPRDLTDLATFGKSLPTASHFQVFMCPVCNSAHVVLFDHDDAPFAQLTVGPTQLRGMVSSCEQVFDLKQKGRSQ